MIKNNRDIENNFLARKRHMIALEKSLKHGQNISGHFLQGHVDDTAKIIKISFVDKTWIIRLMISNNKLSKFLIEKASISINGVSLTISRTRQNIFDIQKVLLLQLPSIHRVQGQVLKYLLNPFHLLLLQLRQAYGFHR